MLPEWEYPPSPLVSQRHTISCEGTQGDSKATIHWGAAMKTVATTWALRGGQLSLCGWL